MASPSTPGSSNVIFPSFKKDVQDGLGVNAETGIWFVFGSGIFVAILITIVASMGLYQNTNFQADDPLDVYVVWTAIAGAVIGAIALLLSPWLVFKSTNISSIYFMFLILILGITITSLLAISQSQQTDASETYETATFWVMIIMIVFAVGGAVGLGTLIWDLNRKQNPPIEPKKTVTKTTTTTKKETPTGTKTIINVKQEEEEALEQEYQQMVTDLNTPQSIDSVSPASSNLLVLTDSDLNNLNSVESPPLVKNGILITSKKNQQGMELRTRFDALNS